MPELALDATSLAFSYLEWNPMAKSLFQFEALWSYQIYLAGPLIITLVTLVASGAWIAFRESKPPPDIELAL